MGSTLSVVTGYGVVLPTSEDDDDFLSTHRFYDQFIDGDNGRIDSYAVETYVHRNFPLLCVESSYFIDWYGDCALMIKSTKVESYYAGVNPIPISDATDKEKQQLHEAMARFGVDNPQWLSVVSYG